MTRQPLDVLRAIPELELVPLTESDVCCGSAGIYNLVEPDTSNVVLERKLAHIADGAARARRDGQSRLHDADRRRTAAVGFGDARGASGRAARRELRSGASHCVRR